MGKHDKRGQSITNTDTESQIKHYLDAWFALATSSKQTPLNFKTILVKFGNSALKNVIFVALKIVV
jgi:antibiotic biosynthesis monooxygenase (ABM) superfamily enzyme